MSDKIKLTKVIGVPAMLEQTAEEALELAFACLKLARMYRGDNAVHGYSEEDLKKSIEEESADVLLCVDEMIEGGIIGDHEVIDWYEQKSERMAKRLSDIPEGSC